MSDKTPSQGSEALFWKHCTSVIVFALGAAATASAQEDLHSLAAQFPRAMASCDAAYGQLTAAMEGPSKPPVELIRHSAAFVRAECEAAEDRVLAIEPPRSLSYEGKTAIWSWLSGARDIASYRQDMAGVALRFVRFQTEHEFTNPNGVRLSIEALSTFDGMVKGDLTKREIASGLLSEALDKIAKPKVNRTSRQRQASSKEQSAFRSFVAQIENASGPCAAGHREVQSSSPMTTESRSLSIIAQRALSACRLASKTIEGASVPKSLTPDVRDWMDSWLSELKRQVSASTNAARSLLDLSEDRRDSHLTALRYNRIGELTSRRRAADFLWEASRSAGIAGRD